MRKPGYAFVFCDFHPWERAIIQLLPHRYFAVTDARGWYTIHGIPPGTYAVADRHETLSTPLGPPRVRRIVTIQAGATTVRDVHVMLNGPGF